MPGDWICAGIPLKTSFFWTNLYSTRRLAGAIAPMVQSVMRLAIQRTLIEVIHIVSALPRLLMAGYLVPALNKVFRITGPSSMATNYATTNLMYPWLWTSNYCFG